MKVAIPKITFGPVEIPAGIFLNVTLLGVKLKIPPGDIKIIPKVTILEETVLFDTDDITSPIQKMVKTIPNLVWNMFESTLDSMAEDYYKRHPEEEK